MPLKVQCEYCLANRPRKPEHFEEEQPEPNFFYLYIVPLWKHFLEVVKTLLPDIVESPYFGLLVAFAIVVVVPLMLNMVVLTVGIMIPIMVHLYLAFFRSNPEGKSIKLPND